MRVHPSTGRGAVSTRTRADWILWAQLGCALVATAHAEYALASATGLHWLVAGAVPGALDLYVIRALQKSKDVLPAVLVMVAANVASILVSNGVLAVGPAVLAAVGALAPLLVWRGHVIRVHPGAVSAPVPDTDTPSLLTRVRTWRLHSLWEMRTRKPSAPALDTDADWLPHFLTEQVHPTPVPAPSAPALPPGYAASAPVFVSVLAPGDDAFIALAQEYVATTAGPSVRGLMKYASVGQDRAGRLLTHLGVKPVRSAR